MKFGSFDECWSAICSLLTPRPELYHWSIAGHAKGRFSVTSVDGNGILVLTTTQERFVSRRDFAAIFPFWNDYCDKRIPRNQLNFCVNTTYVLSIFHWLALQANPGSEQDLHRR